jgi:SagB-type dehydrogenase family enzyme
MTEEDLERYRYFLKDSVRREVDFRRTDQSMGVSPPPAQKPYEPDATLVDLPDGVSSLRNSCRMQVGEAILERESRRSFAQDSLSLEELSALLYAVQGVRRKIREGIALRTVPSAGARHSFETYIAVDRVEGLEAGLYRYLPFDGKLLQLYTDQEIAVKAARACLGQGFVASAAATFFWTSIPARMEWRYGKAAHKVIAVDAGHVGQNLYLACEALGAGTCAIAAYDQEACDRLLGVDGQEEFTVYISPVGK